MARPIGTKKPGLKYLSESQLKAFNSALEQNGSLRDQVMLRLCLYLGLRVQELVNIRIQDMDPESRAITIQALKNGRKRTYSALPQSLWALLMRYIRKEKPKDALFPITAQTAKNVFKKYAGMAGLSSAFSIHSLRHTCGMLQTKNGNSPVQVMLWLRHRSLQSTQVYIEQTVFENDSQRMNELMVLYL